MSTNDEVKVHLDHILTEVAKTQNITNYELNPNTTANYGDGFVAQFFFGEIQNKDTNNTTSVAIKKAPTVEFDYKSLFVSEYIFYETVFPVLDQQQKEKSVLNPFDNVPTYFSGNVSEPKKEYIAMENLKPLNYVMFDKTKFFDQEHLELIFKTYGKFHALSFVLRQEDFETYQNITKDVKNFGVTFAALAGKQILSAVSAAVRALDEEKDKVVCEELVDFGENAVATFEKAYQYNGQYKCFLHGDCWSNNMLFKYSEAGKLLDIKLLDFQVCHDGTPIHDLAYFFYSGASKNDFDNLESFLKIYYKSFVEFSKELGMNTDKLFSFEELINEWKENALLGVMLGIWLWQIKLTSKEEFTKLIEEVKGMSQEEMSPLLKDFEERTLGSRLFKENTTSILKHAVEYGILNKSKIFKKIEKTNQ